MNCYETGYCILHILATPKVMSDLLQTATPASAHAKVSRRWMSGRYSQDVVVVLVCYAVLFAAVIVIFFAAVFAAMGVAPAKGATVVKPKASFVLNGALNGSLKSQAAVCSIIKHNHLVTVSFDGLK